MSEAEAGRSWPGRAWHALTRQREHQLLDFLLGLAALIIVVSWVGGFSPLLAVAMFAAATVAYLTTLRKQEHARKAQAATPPTPRSVGVDAALDLLDTRLAGAPEVPLTAQVRLDPSDVASLVDEVRVAARGTGEEKRVEQLALVLVGRPVLFTNQVRVDMRRARRLVAELRAQLVSSASG